MEQNGADCSCHSIKNMFLFGSSYDNYKNKNQQKAKEKLVLLAQKKYYEQFYNDMKKSISYGKGKDPCN